MKLPRYTAQTPPPRETGLARAYDIPALVRTGETAIWRGVSRAGEAIRDVSGLLFNIHQYRKGLDDDLQTKTRSQNIKSSGQTIWDEIKDGTRGEITTVEEGDKIGATAVSEFRATINEQMAGASPRVKHNLKLLAIEAIPTFRKGTDKVTSAIWREHYLAEEKQIITSLIAEGRYDEAFEEVEALDTAGIITHQAALDMKDDVEKQKLLLAIKVAGETFLDEDVKDAEDMIEESKVFATEEDKSFYRKQLRSVLKRNAALLKQARAAEIDTEQGRLMDLVRKNELTEDTIRESALDEFGKGSKDTFYKMIDAQAKAVLQEKEAPFKVSDPETKAKVLEQIRNDEISRSEISELVGKGLSADDADRFISNMEFYKDFWFKRSDMFFKSQLGWDGAYEKFMHPEGGLAYKFASDELFKAIETEGLKGRDIYDRGSQIAIPYIMDYWENVLMLPKPQLERMVALLKGEAVEEPETKKPTEPKEREKIKSVIDPEGIW